MSAVSEITEPDFTELRAVVKEARDAADGYSNDEEIQALQDALKVALDLLGYIEEEPEPTKHRFTVEVTIQAGVKYPRFTIGGDVKITNDSELAKQLLVEHVQNYYDTTFSMEVVD